MERMNILICNLCNGEISDKMEKCKSVFGVRPFLQGENLSRSKNRSFEEGLKIESSNELKRIFESSSRIERVL